MLYPLAPLVARTKRLARGLRGGLNAYMLCSRAACKANHGLAMRFFAPVVVGMLLFVLPASSHAQSLVNSSHSVSSHPAGSAGDPRQWRQSPPTSRYWWTAFGVGAALVFRLVPQRDAPLRASSPLDDWAHDALRAPTQG